MKKTLNQIVSRGCTLTNFARAKLSLTKLICLVWVIISSCFFHSQAQAASGPIWCLDYDEQNLSEDEICMAECMQGLVNRGGPQIFYTTYDWMIQYGDSLNLASTNNPAVSHVWLNYLTNSPSVGGLGMQVTNVANLRALIQMAINSGAIAGVVRYDPTNINGEETEIALTLCAQLKGLPVTDEIYDYQSPGLLTGGTNLCFEGLPVLADIRGEWATTNAAVQWGISNLLAASSTNETMCDGAHYYGSTGDVGPGGCCESGFDARDYAVMKNCYFFDFINAYSGLNTILSHLHSPAPVLGVWPAYGGGESESSSLPPVSGSNNYWLLTHHAMDISFLAGISVPTNNVNMQRPLSNLKLNNTNYYVLFQTAEGDTMKQAWDDPGSQGWNWPGRGTIPVGWGINPSLSERVPIFLQWMNTYAGPKDTFFAGPGGAGYVWLTSMSSSGQTALGAATQPLLEATGLELVDMWNADTPSFLNYSYVAPAVQAFTGQAGPINEVLPNGVVHAQCPWGTGLLWYPMENGMTNVNQVTGYIENLSTVQSPPYFIVVYDSVDYIPEMAQIAASNLPSQYVIVGAEDFVNLQHQKASAEQNALANGNWTPTTPGGSNGTNGWSYTYISNSEGAYQLDDYWNAAFDPSTDGATGFLKAEVNGTDGDDYQFATSPWFPVTPGSVWQASVYGEDEYGNMHGQQQGLMKIQFAGTNDYNILGSAQNVVVTTNNPDDYQYGTVGLTAPSGAAYVNMQVGVFNPVSGTAAGYALFDGATLMVMPNNILSNPNWNPSVVNGTDGGYNWQFTYNSNTEGAYQLNDFWDVGYHPSGNGSTGMLKVEVNGTIAGDFQIATSQWYPAIPGSLWQASVYGNSQGTDLNGPQQGLVKIQFAGTNDYNILTGAQDVVITTNSSSGYHLGTVNLTAPTGAAYVNMQVGVLNPASGTASGSALFGGASLAEANDLPNPNWAPTTPGGSNGSNDWSYTFISNTEGAYQLDDYWNAGYFPSTNGSTGMLKACVNGTNGDDYQFATSPWFPATPGSSWQASVYGEPQYLNLYGEQQGLMKIQFADANHNILSSASNVVITSSSPDTYTLGTVSLAAPSGTVYVNMQVGVFNPVAGTQAGYALFGGAKLINFP